jgi:integrase
MGLYKRNQVWWMSFTYQGQQVRKSTETSDRRLAQAILGKVNAKIVEGRYFETLQEQDRTFAEMMERYLKEYSPRKAPTSHRRDQQDLLHLLPVFGDKTLAAVTPRLLAEYKVQRREEGAAPATINKELGLVRHAFNMAIREWEWCRENPMHRVRMEPVHNQIDRWLTAEEERRLLAAAPAWLQEIIIFALHTGMRRGEILSLQWQDLDFSRGVLVVMNSKNRERRTIPLNVKVFELLAGKQQTGMFKKGEVFTSSQGTTLDARNLMRAFYAAMEKARIINFRFHDLRHTFATRLVQMGVDLYKVQRLLGHKTPAITQRYAHHSPESLRDSVAVLEKKTESGLSHFYHSREEVPGRATLSTGKNGAGNGI